MDMKFTTDILFFEYIIMMLINHNNMCDLATVIMLTYEYGKILKLKKDIDFRQFCNINYLNQYLDCSIYRSLAIKYLIETTPFGRIHKYHFSNETGLQAAIFVNEYKKKLHIVFRGTDHDIDWRYNLKFFQKKLDNSNICIHQGFFEKLHDDNMYKKIENDILTLLLQYTNFEIIVTGHSLGAALATLFSFELSKKTTNLIKLVTFASPRIGNYEFKTEFESTKHLVHYRITNNRDIVTAIPFFNYYHVGINIFISEDKIEIFNKNTNDLCFKFSLFNCFSFCDHDMDSYFKRILENKW